MLEFSQMVALFLLILYYVLSDVAFTYNNNANPFWHPFIATAQFVDSSECLLEILDI